MNHSLTKLLHLVSPTLPIGAYAYSQGQEYAIDASWVKDKTEAYHWIGGILTNSLSATDLPCLIRLYNAWSETHIPKVITWNQYILSCRETREILLEDQQLGMALQRLLHSLEVEESQAYKELASPSYITMFALAGVKWDIPLDALLQGFVWSWLENQVAAATKLIPLGQTQAQQLLLALSDLTEQALSMAYHVQDSEIGAGLPALAIASSLHERQYSRLFRS